MFRMTDGACMGVNQQPVLLIRLVGDGMSGRRGKLKRQREGVSEFVSITGAEEAFAEKFLEARFRKLAPLLPE